MAARAGQPAVTRRAAVWRPALLLALIYTATALGPLLWSRQADQVAALWYANALAAAVLLRRPMGDWPVLAAAVALAVVLCNVLVGDGPWRALAFVPPHLAEMLLAAWGMRRAGLAESALRSPQPWLDLLLRGALLPPLVGGTIGAATLSSLDGAPFGKVWLQWFEGAAIGAVGMLPLASLVLRESPASLRRHGSDWRLLVLAPLAMGVTLLAMAHLPFPFVVMALPLLLAAMMLEPVAAALVVFLVSLTGAVAMAVGIFVPPPMTRDIEHGFIYLAFAASLVPAQLLCAAMADMRDSHARLSARERELARANLGLEQFVRMASHDLREPLNTITQFGRLVEEDHGDALPATARRYLHLMNGGAERMRRLLDDVLHFARVQRGVVEDSRPVLLATVLHDVQAALAARIQRSGARVEVEDLPEVRGQASMLQLLFQNLLSNAIKFVPTGQVPRIHISAECQHGVARITVADQGIGIAEADFDKLFKPFQRLHLQRQFEGTGLGLALARQIAHAHGGDIEVWSRPGQGSRFTVLLPLADGGGDSDLMR